MISERTFAERNEIKGKHEVFHKIFIRVFSSLKSDKCTDLVGQQICWAADCWGWSAGTTASSSGRCEEPGWKWRFPHFCLQNSDHLKLHKLNVDTFSPIANIFFHRFLCHRRVWRRNLQTRVCCGYWTSGFTISAAVTFTSSRWRIGARQNVLSSTPPGGENESAPGTRRLPITPLRPPPAHRLRARILKMYPHRGQFGADGRRRQGNQEQEKLPCNFNPAAIFQLQCTDKVKPHFNNIFDLISFEKVSRATLSSELNTYCTFRIAAWVTELLLGGPPWVSSAGAKGLLDNVLVKEMLWSSEVSGRRNLSLGGSIYCVEENGGWQPFSGWNVKVSSWRRPYLRSRFCRRACSGKWRVTSPMNPGLQQERRGLCLKGVGGGEGLCSLECSRQESQQDKLYLLNPKQAPDGPELTTGNIATSMFVCTVCEKSMKIERLTEMLRAGLGFSVCI